MLPRWRAPVNGHAPEMSARSRAQGGERLHGLSLAYSMLSLLIRPPRPGNAMPRTVTLAIDLPASARRLYRMYLDPQEHAAFTGSPVKIAARSGAKFKAFAGALSGKILQLIPDRLIVQSWRSNKFSKRAIDSTLVLAFRPAESGTRIELTHVNVADSDFAGVSEGWSKYYWTPWRAYLQRD
jgi:activator of HSP90 ATPase